MYEQKLNSGALFKNEKKKDTHPDLRGTIKLSDGDYEISAWKKSGKSGEFLSLSIRKKEEKANNNLPF